jgi:hypothetical protein
MADPFASFGQNLQAGLGVVHGLQQLAIGRERAALLQAQQQQAQIEAEALLARQKSLMDAQAELQSLLESSNGKPLPTELYPAFLKLAAATGNAEAAAKLPETMAKLHAAEAFRAVQGMASAFEAGDPNGFLRAALDFEALNTGRRMPGVLRAGKKGEWVVELTEVDPRTNTERTITRRFAPETIERLVMLFSDKPRDVAEGYRAFYLRPSERAVQLTQAAENQATAELRGTEAAVLRQKTPFELAQLQAQTDKLRTETAVNQQKLDEMRYGVWHRALREAFNVAPNDPLINQQPIGAAINATAAIADRLEGTGVPAKIFAASLAKRLEQALSEEKSLAGYELTPVVDRQQRPAWLLTTPETPAGIIVPYAEGLAFAEQLGIQARVPLAQPERQLRSDSGAAAPSTPLLPPSPAEQAAPTDRPPGVPESPESLTGPWLTRPEVLDSVKEQLGKAAQYLPNVDREPSPESPESMAGPPPPRVDVLEAVREQLNKVAQYLPTIDRETLGQAMQTVYDRVATILPTDAEKERIATFVREIWDSAVSALASDREQAKRMLDDLIQRAAERFPRVEIEQLPQTIQSAFEDIQEFVRSSWSAWTSPESRVPRFSSPEQAPTSSASPEVLNRIWEQVNRIAPYMPTIDRETLGQAMRTIYDQVAAVLPTDAEKERIAAFVREIWDSAVAALPGDDSLVMRTLNDLIERAAARFPRAEYEKLRATVQAAFEEIQNFVRTTWAPPAPYVPRLLSPEQESVLRERAGTASRF